MDCTMIILEELKKIQSEIGSDIINRVKAIKENRKDGK